MRFAMLIIIATIVCTAKATGGSDLIRFDYQPKKEEVTVTIKTEEAKDETETEAIYVAPQVVYHRVAPQKDCFVKRFVRRLRRR